MQCNNKLIMNNPYTPENFLVDPVNEELLLKHIEGIVNPSLQPNESIRIDVGAIACNNCEINQDCIYEIAHKIWKDGKPVFLFNIPVRIKTKTEGGTSHSMFPSFYFQMSLEEIDPFLLPEISLKEFMGSRFDYNPRINKNMKDFMKMINDNLTD